MEPAKKGPHEALETKTLLRAFHGIFSSNDLHVLGQADGEKNNPTLDCQNYTWWFLEMADPQRHEFR